uniref:Uncharacterized protein n=1 Tax=Anguilla anguilla TaxID=7936 RepID=A0A0E9W2Z4_ANGAN
MFHTKYVNLCVPHALATEFSRAQHVSQIQVDPGH